MAWPSFRRRARSRAESTRIWTPITKPIQGIIVSQGGVLLPRWSCFAEGCAALPTPALDPHAAASMGSLVIGPMSGGGATSPNVLPDWRTARVVRTARRLGPRPAPSAGSSRCDVDAGSDPLGSLASCICQLRQARDTGDPHCKDRLTGSVWPPRSGLGPAPALGGCGSGMRPVEGSPVWVNVSAEAVREGGVHLSEPQAGPRLPPRWLIRLDVRPDAPSGRSAVQTPMPRSFARL